MTETRLTLSMVLLFVAMLVRAGRSAGDVARRAYRYAGRRRRC